MSDPPAAVASRIRRPNAAQDHNDDIVVLMFEESSSTAVYHTLKRSLLLPFITKHTHASGEYDAAVNANLAPPEHTAPSKEGIRRQSSGVSLNLGDENLEEVFEITRQETVNVRMIRRQKSKQFIGEEEEETGRYRRVRRRASVTSNDVARPDVSARDLRFVDRSIDLEIHEIKPAVLVRNNCLVISLLTLRAVIVPHRMLVFVDINNDDDLQPLLTTMSQRTTLYSREAASTEEDEGEDGAMSPSAHGDNLPFELFCLESILAAVCAGLTRRKLTLQQKAKDLMAVLRKASGTASNLSKFQSLRFIGIDVTRFLSVAAGIERVVGQLLDDDNTLHGLVFSTSREAPAPAPVAWGNVSFHHDGESVRTTDEPVVFNASDFADELVEVLVDSYFAQITAAVQRLTNLKAEVDDVCHHAKLVYDNSKVSLWSVQVALSFIVCCLSLAMLVANYFGMNLGNTEQPYAGNYNVFLAVVFSTAGFVVVTVLIGVLCVFRNLNAASHE